eukprot:COSAG05_NODE_1009_length_6209_cov_4.160393_1_plen_471_part_00
MLSIQSAQPAVAVQVASTSATKSGVRTKTAANTPPPGWDKTAWDGMSKAQQIHHRCAFGFGFGFDSCFPISAAPLLAFGAWFLSRGIVCVCIPLRRKMLKASTESSPRGSGAGVDAPFAHPQLGETAAEQEQGSSGCNPPPVGDDGKPLTGIKLKLWEKKNSRGKASVSSSSSGTAQGGAANKNGKDDAYDGLTTMQRLHMERQQKQQQEKPAAEVAPAPPPAPTNQTATKTSPDRKARTEGNRMAASTQARHRSNAARAEGGGERQAAASATLQAGQRDRAARSDLAARQQEQENSALQPEPIAADAGETAALEEEQPVDENGMALTGVKLKVWQKKQAKQRQQQQPEQVKPKEERRVTPAEFERWFATVAPDKPSELFTRFYAADIEGCGSLTLTQFEKVKRDFLASNTLTSSSTTPSATRGTTREQQREMQEGEGEGGPVGEDGTPLTGVRRKVWNKPPPAANRMAV